MTFLTILLVAVAVNKVTGSGKAKPVEADGDITSEAQCKLNCPLVNQRERGKDPKTFGCQPACTVETCSWALVKTEKFPEGKYQCILLENLYRDDVAQRCRYVSGVYYINSINGKCVRKKLYVEPQRNSQLSKFMYCILTDTETTHS